jgi:hypothetical protein
MVKNFQLFGFNKNQDLANFGSDTFVTYQVAGGSSTYRELLAQSAIKNFEVLHWQIVSTDATNISQVLLFNYIDANGRRMVDPIPINIYKDAYQVSADMVILKYKAKIDGTYYISGQLAKSSSILFCIYPNIIANMVGLLYDEGDVQIIQKYNEPVTSKYIEFLKQKNNL